MEMVRRLAQGELAEVLGPALLDTDKLFRTLGIRRRAAEAARQLDPQHPATQGLLAYLDGINQYQASRALPLEFKLLGIAPRPFTPQDTVAVSGYLAYSFAAAFRTEPVLTHLRDALGAAYLSIFRPESSPGSNAKALALDDATWRQLGQLARLSLEAVDRAGLPLLEGSNAWAIAGSRTASGKPVLAGDPHIAYGLPSVWYEAHLSAPGFELYGHHQALSPYALLGHNQDFGWTLTMFQNDDIDLIAEKPNPRNADEVWHRGRWVALETVVETIRVKKAPAVELRLRRSPHGPIITDAFKDTLGGQPVALWWAFLDTENPILEAFYELNRAQGLAQARAAASKIHAPGLNVVWASASGDIAWWAAARLPLRPPGVDGSFILDGSSGQADKPGFAPFSQNPQEENPPRGFIASANQAPAGNAPPGYYNLGERARRIEAALQTRERGWTVAHSQALQLEPGTDYGPQLLRLMLPDLRAQTSDAGEQALLVQLSDWDGRYTLESQSATVFNQLLYEVARASLADELPAVFFEQLLRTRAIDHALPRLLADPSSPWWDDRATPEKESRAQTLRRAWQASLAHLQALYGPDRANWTWGRAHTLTHVHPLGRQAPLDRLFNVGPFAQPGSREVPNNLAAPLGPAPWKVTYGPSTRRAIDWAEPGAARGINPLGQSGVLWDRHYQDQAALFHQGGSAPQHLLQADVQAHTRSILRLVGR
jgi:penicillin amidase